ncbi:MAG: hypothetical protein ACFCVK_08705 [Acidimicrobiales bacterium]
MTRSAPENGDVRSVLAHLVRSGGLDLAPPGRGDTPHRHRALFDVARRWPVAVARCAEAHTDALAILAEAGRRPVGPGTLYGVWASGGDLSFDPASATVSGTKPFCSGLGIVDRALVTTDGGTGPLLLDLDVGPDRPGLRLDRSGWRTSTLAAARTGTVVFDRHPTGDGRPIGGPGWYLDRPGFWHGACGPAACWAGAAAGLVDVAEELIDDDPHRRAHLGALRAATWAAGAVLDAAGREIDRWPDDGEAARYRALAARHVIERHCADILDRFGRALGPRPFVGMPETDQRFADTHLYLRQDHAERDLHRLADLPPTADRAGWGYRPATDADPGR